MEPTSETAGSSVAPYPDDVSSATATILPFEATASTAIIEQSETVEQTPGTTGSGQQAADTLSTVSADVSERVEAVPTAVNLVPMTSPADSSVAASETAAAAPLALPTSDTSNTLLPLKRPHDDEMSSGPVRIGSTPALVDPFSNPESKAYKAAKSASQWNSLLRWARRARGPQWDWSTGVYHVDLHSQEYYSGVTRLESASSLPSHLHHPTAVYANGQSVNAGGSSNGGTAPGTPSASGAGAGGMGGTDAGVYDSGRPRRTRAAMGR